VFEELLRDPETFARRRTELKSAGHRSGPETSGRTSSKRTTGSSVPGSLPSFLHAWDPERFEQTVVGNSIFASGKRPDAVMRTAGALSALVFVGFKAHSTELLHSGPYRQGHASE